MIQREFGANVAVYYVRIFHDGESAIHVFLSYGYDPQTRTPLPTETYEQLSRRLPLLQNSEHHLDMSFVLNLQDPLLLELLDLHSQHPTHDPLGDLLREILPQVWVQTIEHLIEKTNTR